MSIHVHSELIHRAALGGALIALSLTATACSSTSQQIPTLAPDKFRVSEMKREDYAILGDAKAQACRKVIALWPLPIWFQIAPSFSFYPWIWDAEEDAWQAALASQPQADAVLLPRKTQDSTYAFWFHKVCYEVRGKAIRIKPDDERGPPGAHLLPPPPPPPAPPPPPSVPAP